MRILTVFTGGTIGSKVDGDKKVLDDKKVLNGKNAECHTPKLIAKFLDNNKDYKLENFEIYEPLATFSENMTLGKLSAIMACINGRDLNAYDGIIITHGTDTLAYSAALVAQLTAALPIPVVLVSSNHELDNPRANGHINFRAAVQLIKEGGCRGCFVSYSYDLVNANIYLGSRIIQSQPFEDKYRSLGGEDFAMIKPGGVIIRDKKAAKALNIVDKKAAKEVNTVDKKAVNALNIATKPSEMTKDWLGTMLKANVLVLSPYVGINYDNYNISCVDGVVHTTYHSFTYPNEGSDKGSVLSLIKRCEAAKIKFAFAPNKREDTTYYGTNILDIDPMCYNQTAETVYAKMVIAISRKMDDEAYRAYMSADIAAEKAQ